MISASSISTTAQGLTEVLKAYRNQLGQTVENRQKSDPFGTVADIPSLRAELAPVRQGFLTLHEAVSLLQTVDANLQTIMEKLPRLLEIVKQAQSGELTPDQIQTLQEEFDKTANEINQAAHTAEYNGIHLHQQKQTYLFTAAGKQIRIQLEELDWIEGDIENPLSAKALRAFIEFISNYKKRTNRTLRAVEGLSDYLNELLEEITRNGANLSDLTSAKDLLNTYLSQINNLNIPSLMQNNQFAQTILSLLKQ